MSGQRVQATRVVHRATDVVLLAHAALREQAVQLDRRALFKRRSDSVDTPLVAVCGPHLPAITRGAEGSAASTALVVAPDPARRAELMDILEWGGLQPIAAESMRGATRELSRVFPHLLVIDVPSPETSDWALDLIGRIRSARGGGTLPIVVVSVQPSRELTVAALARTADDVVSGEHHPDELVARLRARIERPAVSRHELAQDPVSGALTPASFAEPVWRELERLEHGGRPCVLALVQLEELPELEAHYGARAHDEVVTQVVALIESDSRSIDYVGHTRGVFAILMPATTTQGAHRRLERLVRLLVSSELTAAGEPVSVTPIIGYTRAERGLTREALEERAWVAMMHQAEQLDLHPTVWKRSLSPTHAKRSRRPLSALQRAVTPAQIVVQQLLCLFVPFAAYWAFDSLGFDISSTAYLVIVVALGITALAIWAEGIAALRRPRPPAEPAVLPTATAVVAAYLPNEAETVMETVESLLAQDYPELQVILAYNTPYPLPVENELEYMAERDPRFEPFRVVGSVSKAQNVNAALARVRGTIVGVFDADHHPDQGAFRRAARWLANGADVVQGHCVVRNGGTNGVTRLVATEFEAIYAVSHPGRARLHGFGIFGGSNGYWRTDVLKRKRMRGFMLTEDIDSSMRVVEAGGTIVSDPGLVSTELAPQSLGALWNQRMRWAQGWYQVSLRHLLPMLGRPGASLRSRVGAVYLLAWREIYPWVSLQIFPLMAFWMVRGEPPIDWFVPVFVVTSLFTLTAGPVQVLFAAKLAHPSIKSHRRWFAFSLVASLFFYTEFKNVIVRTAHLKELMGEKTWKVTPRTARPAAARPPDGVERRSPGSVGAPLREARRTGPRPDPLHRIASVLEAVELHRAWPDDRAEQAG
ncbi:MAG TPA: glycosyltransferase [Gaiellaceae bacterium]|nr:glycosyltransferase [Gaiellaceae bacterium]